MKILCYWVYILHCDNGSYYTGYTVNLTKRYQAHVTGTSRCKYTRSFKPLGMAQCWQVRGDKSMAMKMEKFIKQLSKEEKTQFILYPERLAEWFECSPFLFQYNTMSLNEGTPP